jgi:DNA-binding transcriptional LysR family regulator
MNRQRNPRLSLDLLRGFCAAARHLSFTRASQELFVTQSAISQMVKTLEEQLGTPLFRRVNRALLLTQEGEQLYRAVDEALEQIDSTARQVAGAERSLSITAPVPFASLWLGPRLPGYISEKPDIAVRVVASNDLLDLGRERLDVAIRYVARGVAAPSQQKLFDYETFPVCSPELARDAKRPLRTPADLAHHVLLELELVRNGRPWYDWQQWLAEMRTRGIKAAGSRRFSHYDQLIAAAVEGCGVAMGKMPHLSSHLQRGLLVAPFGDEHIARLGAFYVVVSENAQREAADEFVSWLYAEAKKDAESARKPVARKPSGSRAKRTRP